MGRRARFTKDDLRRTVGVLQQFQILIRPEMAERDTSLADLVCFVQTMQQEFGGHASLEDTIQALVSLDLERQQLPQETRRKMMKV